MTRPRTTALALLATTALVLAACGSPPTAPDSGGGRQAAEKKELPPCPLDALEKATSPVEVKMWYSGIVDPPRKVLLDLIADFNASQDKVKVTADSQGTAYAEGMRKYQNAAATPDQLPDMLLVEDTDLGEMVDRGQILPVQSCMEADNYDITQITPAARAAYSVDDVLYPGFFNVSTPILYYNKADFEKAGLDPNKPPRTLAEIMEYAQKIKDAGVAPLPLSFLANEWFLSQWLAGVGQDAVNNNNGRSGAPSEATFDTPEMVGVLEFLKDMNSKKLINAFPVTDGKIDHYLALLGEKHQSSMLIETSTASGTIAGALGGEISAAGAGFDLSSDQLSAANLIPAAGEMPGIKAPGKIYASGGAFFIMNTGTPAQQAASWKFYEFMLQPENAIKWHLLGGYLPMLKATIDDPRVADFQEKELDGNLLQPAVEQLAVADPDNSGPLIGPYQAYQDGLRGAMESVLFDGGDPATEVARAEKSVTTALTEYNAG